MTSLFSFLFLSSIAIGNVFKLSLFSPDVQISPLDLIVIVANFVAFFRKPQTPAKPLLVFLGISGVSLLASFKIFGIQAATVGFFYWFRFVMYTCLYFSLSTIFSKAKLKLLIFAIGITIVVSGICQYVISPDIRHLAVSDWDPHYYRIVGTLLDPGFIGILLVLFLLFVFQNPPNNKLHYYLLQITTYTTLALTYSRSSYLALLVASASVSYTKKSWKPFIFTFFILLFTIFALPRSPGGEGVKLERTNSITARIQNWRNSFAIFSDHPVIGVGFNAYRYAQNNAGFLQSSNWLKSHAGAGADSSLLFVAATTGVIGLIFYLNLIRNLFLIKPIRYELAALLTHSLFLNSLFYPFVLFWLAALVSISLKEKN